MKRKFLIGLLALLAVVALPIWAEASNADLVRVGLTNLANSDNRISVHFDGAHAIYQSSDSGEPLRQVATANSYYFSIKNGQVHSTDDNGLLAELDFVAKRSQIRPSDDCRMTINGQWQIGAFSLGVAADNQLIAVVTLDRDRYLKGVLPREMSPSAPLEALKAQAVAARTFSIRQMNRFDSAGYDICDSSRCQVYGGPATWRDSTNRAVEETAGLCVAYRNYPANTFYHASSGGFVENSEDIFASPLGYIQADRDPYSQSDSDYCWTAQFSRAELSERLAKSGHDIGSVQQFVVKKRLPSGRIVALTAIGDRATVTLEKEKIRSALGYDKVKSLLFNFNDATAAATTYYVANGQTVTALDSATHYAVAGDGALSALDNSALRIYGSVAQPADAVVGDDFTISGRGWGHGLGMSQYGAQKMAEQGFDFRAILQFYYKDTTLMSTEDLTDADQ